MKAVILLISVLSFFCSCNRNDKASNQEKFDKIKWQTKEGSEYPYRNNMLKDLVANYTVSGLKKEAVIHLLGEPTRRDSSYLFYRVHQDLFADILPIHTRTLVIKLTKDSIVEWRKIHE
jgi:hypothetical protein